MATLLKDEGTLRNQEESLKTENVVLRYAVYGELGVGALLTLYGLFTLLTSGSYAFIVFGGFVLFLGMAHAMKRSENEDAADKIAAGRSGEEFVSDLLEENLPDDFYLLNDVDVTSGGRTAQNDHLVVAPGGIFLVETKAYAGTLTGTAEAENWTQNKENETNKVTNPVAQSAYHREVLEDFLEAQNLPFREEDLHEFVAMVNKECEWNIEGTGDTVDYAWTIHEDITETGQNKKYDEQARRNLVSRLGVEPPAYEDDEASEPSTGNSVSHEHSDPTAESGEESSNRPSNDGKTTDEFPGNRRSPPEPEAEWWVYRNGSVSERTYTTEELEGLDLNAETKICRAGEESWIPLREIDGSSR